MYFFVSFKICNQLDEEKRAGCFALIVFLMPCDAKCSLALLHGAVCWYAVCECDIT